MTPRRGPSRAQAATEYIVILTLAMLVMFTPWVGGRAPFLMLIEHFQIYLSSFHVVVMLPIP